VLQVIHTLQEENRVLSSEVKSVSQRNTKLEADIAGYKSNSKILKDSLNSLQSFVDKRMDAEGYYFSLEAMLCSDV